MKIFAMEKDKLLRMLRALGNEDVEGQMLLTHGFIDNGITYADKQIDKPVACKIGCAKCCELGVSVVAEEAIVIGRQVHRDAALKEQVLSRIEKNQDARKSYRAIPDIALAGTPCVFLKEGQCTIYAIRPMGCRSHHSYDAKACEKVSQGMERNLLRDMVSSSAEQVLHLVRPMHARPDLELEDALAIYLQDPVLAEERFAQNKQPFYGAKKWTNSSIVLGN